MIIMEDGSFLAGPLDRHIRPYIAVSAWGWLMPGFALAAAVPLILL